MMLALFNCWDLAHASLFDPFLNAIDADRSLFKKRNLIADLSIRRHQESLSFSFHPVTREGNQQQTVFRYGGAEIG